MDARSAAVLYAAPEERPREIPQSRALLSRMPPLRPRELGTAPGPTQTVTIKNLASASTGTLVAKGLGGYAMLALWESTCAGALGPGASCSFKISFAPAQAKAECAVYTIGDGTTSWTVVLAGTRVR
jgi:hypothetical protein